VICTKRRPNFVRSRGDTFFHCRPFPSEVTGSLLLTLPWHAPIFFVREWRGLLVLRGEEYTLDFKRHQAVRSESGALDQPRIARGSRSWVSISIGCSDGTHHGLKLWSAGVGGLALNRDRGSYTIHIGIKDLHFGTSALSRPTWHYAKASRPQRAQYPIRGHRVGMLPACQSKGPCKINIKLIASNRLLITFGL
jgi:hypothetical protein